MKNKKFNLIFDIIIMLVMAFFAIAVVMFSVVLIKLNIIPWKYILVLFLVLLLFLIALLVCVIKSKGYILKTIIMVLLVIISSGLLYGRTYLDKTYQFIGSLQTEEYNTLTYSVIVLKSSEFEKLEDLSGKKVTYLKDSYSSDVESKIDFDCEKNVTSNFGEMTNSFMKGEVDAIILDDDYLELAKESIENFEDITWIIGTFEVKIKNEIIESNTDISSESFILYISGIDQYGKVTSIRGRSDVNQLAVINPKTHKILLVNTPRDFYVQLHGTTGLKDKLTHAGIYGIDKSKNTLSDLYGVDIDYYLRVNFNTLINVVDVIGGLDIYSDKAFTAWTNKSVHVEKGWNHFDGRAALAYSRERYTYATGDRHRGENQQQVISSIIEKLTTKEVLLKNYNNILDTLSGTFQTNMDMNTITGFLRYQLDKMPKWEVESISVTGSDARNYTYSMGTNYLLYVMEPNMNSVNIAKAKIKEVLNEG